LYIIGKIPIITIKFHKMNFFQYIKKYTDAPMTHGMLLEVLKEYKRPNDKISELVKSGTLLNLRRGLYLSGKQNELPPLSPFLIANHLRGPSYVSLESALSYWGIIPERVYQISSVTTKSPKIYENPVGRFSYTSLPLPYYCFGIKNIEFNKKQNALIASAEKAVCDKIILTPGVLLRSITQTLDFLLEDLRMDEGVLKNLDISLINSWIKDSPKKESIKFLTYTLQDL